MRSFDISGSLVEYRFIPHNSLLGLFAFAGPIGFLGFWSIVVVAVTLCVRAYRMLPVGRVGASVATRVRAGWAVGGLILYSIQSWADIGLQSPYAALIAGLCCGIAGAVIRDAHAIREHPLVGADLAPGSPPPETPPSQNSVPATQFCDQNPQDRRVAEFRGSAHRQHGHDPEVVAPRHGEIPDGPGHDRPAHQDMVEPHERQVEERSARRP